MRRIRVFSLLLAILLITTMMQANSAKTGDALAEIPYGKHNSKVSPYTSKKTIVYSEEEAFAAGVPTGFSGYVYEIKGDGAMGFTVDFSDRRLPVRIVKAIHFRVYYGTDQREVRVSIDAGVSWVMRHEATKPGTWDDVVLKGENEIKKLANEDRNLGVFGFGFRNNEGVTNSTAYVDAITVELFDGDDVPPVITYDGPDHVVTTAGKQLILPVSAWDEGEKQYFSVEYVWSGDALDGEGKMKEGEYSVTLRAKDSYGNTSEKVISVTVGPKDTEAPVIHFAPDTVETLAGALPVLNFKATDNEDEPEITLEWSEGALDKKGRLNEGAHTLTVTASDLTGNSQVREITVKAAPDI